MANTYVLIASNTLSSTAASVTFSSIPNTYTDLVLKVSVRTTRSSTSDDLQIQLNGSSSAIYSSTRLQGNGSVTLSGVSSGNTSFEYHPIVGNNATSNTFSNGEIYIPSYTVSQNKQFSAIGMGENNATSAVMNAVAQLWRSTAAITSIALTPLYGPNFESDSSFFLYGIKNS